MARTIYGCLHRVTGVVQFDDYSLCRGATVTGCYDPAAGVVRATHSECGLVNDVAPVDPVTGKFCLSVQDDCCYGPFAEPGGSSDCCDCYTAPQFITASFSGIQDCPGDACDPPASSWNGTYVCEFIGKPEYTCYWASFSPTDANGGALLSKGPTSATWGVRLCKPDRAYSDYRAYKYADALVFLADFSVQYQEAACWQCMINDVGSIANERVCVGGPWPDNQCHGHQGACTLHVPML